MFIGLHLLVSGAVEAAFAWRFGHTPRTIASHILVLAAWDLALFGLFSAVVVLAPRARSKWPGVTYRALLAVTCTLQVYLYTLDAISNAFWGRNMNAHLVAAFAPTVWTGKEPFPVGAVGISAFVGGTLLLLTACFAWWGAPIGRRTATWLADTSAADGGRRMLRLRVVAFAVAMAGLFGATIRWGIASRDNLFWRDEPVASFFRPVGFAFEPTARRLAVVDRDAALQAAYPRHVPNARRKHVILIIVDSLRADHMQVYGYGRPTTPFLSRLVQDGRMKKVEAAFSSCSESFCGITSTLASREFRDISARTFQLQDVLRDEGYRTWFLLSGNHTAWNGLPLFYRAVDGTFFDGTQTRRYTMDDDRLVLEGLERVPPASPEQPAFFYMHLMSPHFLGVQLPESHVFTKPDDQLSPGLEPFKIRDQLNKPDRYDDKVLQADGIIHQIVDALNAKHYLDNAVMVVTADHGEGLGERHWSHGWDLYNEDIRIPMLFYDAPAATYPDLAFAAQVDIAPTILDRLGLPVPASWDGRSLLAAIPTRFTYHQTYFLPNRFAVLYRDGQALFKFIATPEYGTEELYDLNKDRGEVHNLVAEQPALAALLRDKVRVYREE